LICHTVDNISNAVIRISLIFKVWWLNSLSLNRLNNPFSAWGSSETILHEILPRRISTIRLNKYWIVFFNFVTWLIQY
jgi:hypothetical protein